MQGGKDYVFGGFVTEVLIIKSWDNLMMSDR